MLRFALALIGLAPLAAQVPAEPLKTLRAEHPRLILLDKDLPAFRAALKRDPLARKIYEALVAKGVNQALPIWEAQRWWSVNRFNRNQVCNGGIGIGGRYRSEARTSQQAGWPLDALCKGVGVAFFRSAWDDANAIFVGVKAGDLKVGHSHLDLSGFVLDAGGRRRALDLGADDYNMPQYFG